MSDHQDTCTALGISIMANVPVILWGNPGQGKTSVLNEIADRYDMHLETVIASVREPSDFAGLPVVDAATGTVTLAPPRWARNLADHAMASDNALGIVFYDEISTAPPAVQAAMLRPILDNCVGDFQMPETVRTVAAANPADIAAGGWDLAPPMANRFLHLTWNLPADVVRDGFSVGWPTVDLPKPDPADVERLVRESRILVGSFVGARPELLTKMPSSTEGNLGYPTPRSWEQVATLYGWAMACGANSDVVRMLVTGSVGVSATGEFLTYVANLDLPDPEELLAHPEKFVVPSERPDKVYAIVASVFSAMVNKNSKERWVNAGRILAAVANAGHADIAFTYGVRWTKNRVETATPHPETVAALGPVLTELGRLIKAN